MTHKKNIIILSVIFLILSVIFYGKTGTFLIDFSRESYIPYQITQGQSLIKDIFLIYGPFGYIINAILYSIKVNINLLYIEAHIISYGTLILFYFILNKFYTEKLSLTLSAIFCAVSIFSDSIFSFITPYSFSTLWSVFGIYVALFCLLYNKKRYLFLSLGLILTSKIEFFIPTFIISVAYLIYTKEKFKKDFLFILIIPAITLIYFILNKVTLNDLSQNYFYIKSMLNAKSLKYFYKGMGAYFEIEYFKYNLLLLAKIIGIGLASFILYFYKKPIISYTLLAIGLSIINTNFALNLILFIAIIFTFCSKNKNILSKNEIIWFLFSSILCFKAIFAINSIGYGNFGYCSLIFYTYYQMQKFVNKKWLINSLIIFFVINYTMNIMRFFYSDKVPIKTQIGTIWILKNYKNLFIGTNDFIKKHIKTKENFIVIPEGQIFNLIHKKPYDFYNSTFTPLDFETFGEANLINQLEKNETDYIIVYPRDTTDYKAKNICYDYAVDFCKYIIDNYTQVASIKDGERVSIFKKKR